MVFKFTIFITSIFCCIPAHAALFKYVCEDGTVAAYSSSSYEIDTDEIRNLTEDTVHDFYFDHGYYPVGWESKEGKFVKRCNVVKKEDLMKKIQEEDKKADAKRESDSRKLKEELDARKKKTATFRKNLKVGDKSNFGLVVEVNPPIALIQREHGVQWVRIDELYPQ